ncbi:MAG: hypothetical protein QME52_13975 [Bacteroidota bacterium]|nr:hypothetical protein [Bacteroidota bacterium]
MLVLKENNPRNIFNPVLFWDAEDVDIENNSDYIIARVLDYGDEKDVKAVRSIYSNEKLIEVIKRKRGLMPMTAKFWAAYFQIPFEEIACLRK